MDKFGYHDVPIKGQEQLTHTLYHCNTTQNAYLSCSTYAGTSPISSSCFTESLVSRKKYMMDLSPRGYVSFVLSSSLNPLPCFCL